MVRRTLQLILIGLFLHGAVPFAGGSIFAGNGLGEPLPLGGTRAVGLAGGGLALRDSMSFNTNNPALGAFGRGAQIRMSGHMATWTVTANGETDSDGEAIWSDLHLFLPVHRKYRVGLGIEPSRRADLLTFTNRSVSFEGAGDSLVAYEERAAWRGGTTDIRLDNSYLINNRLALGLSFGYSFINLRREITLDFESDDYRDAGFEDLTRFKGWWTRFGVFWQPHDRLGIGGYFRPRSGGDWELERSENDGSEAILTRRDGDSPSAFGVGISAGINRDLVFTADIQSEFWKLRDLGIMFDDAGGLEVHDPQYLSIALEKRARHDVTRRNMGAWGYRLGFFHRSHYWPSVSGEQVREAGFSVGTSIPVANWLGRLHLAAELGQRGLDEDRAGAIENFLRVFVQIEMSEQWFKRDRPRIPK